MAATIGATITGGVFPPRNANLGPHKSSNGNYYVFLLFSTGLGNVQPYWGTAPMTSLTNAASKVMSSAGSTAVEAMAAYPVGDVIHVATQIATGAVYYNNYNISTGSWGLSSSELAVAAASQAPVVGSTFVDLVVRSTGEPVIAYNAGQTAMSSTFNMVRYTRRTGVATYSAPVNVDNGGSVNWTGGVAVLGASDRVHFFYRGSPGGLYQRTLSAANALQAAPAATLNPTGTFSFSVGSGVSYVDGGVTKVRVPVGYQDASAIRQTDVFALDSADAPTVSTSTIPSAPYAVNNNQPSISLNVDGTTLEYLRVSNADSDIYRHENTGAGWTAQGDEWAGTLIEHTSNIYDRSGTKLAIVANDNATLKYAEITLTAAVTASLIWPTETPYRILSRR